MTTYTLDSLGEPTKIQTPDGGVQTWQRDFAGQPTVYTDELGRVTTYTYQYGAGDGELTQVTDPDGSTIRISTTRLSTRSRRRPTRWAG